MRDLLPDLVAVEVAGAADWTGELLPREARGLGERAVAVRRREFTAGRVCARRALGRLGVHGQPVPVGPDRAPVWPAGMTGSITHTSGYCAAAVAPETAVRSVGIDAERRVVLPADLHHHVCRPEEVAWCQARSGENWWPAVHFSVKEVVYKLWSPIAGTWLDFHDVTLALDPATGAFTARIAPSRLTAAPSAPPVFSGRFVAEPELIRSAGVVLR